MLIFSDKGPVINYMIISAGVCEVFLFVLDAAGEWGKIGCNLEVLFPAGSGSFQRHHSLSLSWFIRSLCCRRGLWGLPHLLTLQLHQTQSSLVCASVAENRPQWLQGHSAVRVGCLYYTHISFIFNNKTQWGHENLLCCVLIYKCKSVSIIQSLFFPPSESYIKM